MALEARPAASETARSRRSPMQVESSMQVEIRSTLPAEAFDALAQQAAAIVLEQLESALLSPYMTVPEAAAYMRCGRQRVDDLLSQGRLTRHKDGARTLVERAEVDTYLSRSGAASGVAPTLPRAPRGGL